MPDKTKPAKMPSMFPIPTHVVKRRLIKTISTGQVPRLIWCPEYVYGQGILVSKLESNGPDSILKNEATTDLASGSLKVHRVTGNWLSGIQQWTPPAGSSSTSLTNLSYIWDQTPALIGDVAEGGARLIGASLKIQYLGKVDDIQGLIIIGLNINGQNVKTGSVPLSDLTFMTDDQIEQAPYHAQYGLQEGVRLIWFPMDQSRFEFNEPHSVVDRLALRTAFPNQGTNGNYTFILPQDQLAGTAGLAQNENFPGSDKFLTGATTNVNTHKLENAGFHDRARMEWHISFQGVSNVNTVKLSIEQYYETIPFEGNQDDYNPTPSPVGDQDSAIRVAHSISKEAAIVSVNVSDSPGFFSSMAAKVMKYAKPYIAPLAASLAASRGMPNLAAGIMYGAGYGNNSSSGGESRLMPYKSRR